VVQAAEEEIQLSFKDRLELVILVKVENKMTELGLQVASDRL
jgi:hypothetical protein